VSGFPPALVEKSAKGIAMLWGQEAKWENFTPQAVAALNAVGWHRETLTIGDETLYRWIASTEWIPE
jgi:hypothetical protein